MKVQGIVAVLSILVWISPDYVDSCWCRYCNVAQDMRNYRVDESRTFGLLPCCDACTGHEDTCGEETSAIVTTTTTTTTVAPYELSLTTEFTGEWYIYGPSKSEGDIIRNIVDELTDFVLRGPICDDMWDDVDAKKLCEQIGFRAGTATVGSTYSSGDNYDAEFDNMYVESDYECTGDEVEMADCTHVNSNPFSPITCSAGKAAGVICTDPLFL